MKNDEEQGILIYSEGWKTSHLHPDFPNDYIHLSLYWYPRAGQCREDISLPTGRVSTMWYRDTMFQGIELVTSKYPARS